MNESKLSMSKQSIGLASAGGRDIDVLLLVVAVVALEDIAIGVKTTLLMYKLSEGEDGTQKQCQIEQVI